MAGGSCLSSMRHPPTQGVGGAGTWCTLCINHKPTPGGTYAYHGDTPKGGNGANPNGLATTLEPES